MITLQYFNGNDWTVCGQFGSEWAAWISLGGDDMNYRTVNEQGEVLTDKSHRIQGEGWEAVSEGRIKPLLPEGLEGKAIPRKAYLNHLKKNN